MKKILLSLLFVVFYCNNSFARFTSFEEKIANLEQVLLDTNFNIQDIDPKEMSSEQLAFLESIFRNGVCEDFALGYICYLSKQIIFLQDKKIALSFRSLTEADIDNFLKSNHSLSFKEKSMALRQLINNANFTPEQLASFVEIVTSGYKSCSLLTNNIDYYCISGERLCVFEKKDSSIMCIDEHDIDRGLEIFKIKLR